MSDRSEAPSLRVVSLGALRAHEDVDPVRSDRLMERIVDDRVQVNPMMCFETPEGDLVLLDGATRTAAFEKLGLTHAVVQMVRPDQIRLETWHHVIRGCDPDSVLDRIARHGALSLDSAAAAPEVHLSDGRAFTVRGVGATANATLSALVDSYVGHWTVSRLIDSSPASVSWRFPDWSAIVRFPHLKMDDVMSAAIGGDLLPAGVSRFLITDRALRLKIDLDILEADETEENKQKALEELLEKRAIGGCIRRYEESVIILDE